MSTTDDDDPREIQKIRWIPPVFTRLCVAVSPYVRAVFAVFPGRICPSRLCESRGETRTGFVEWDWNSVEASWFVRLFGRPRVVRLRAPELPSSRLPGFPASTHVAIRA